MAIAAGDLTLLRSDNHRVELFASILQPRDLWAAQVDDGTITNGEQTIAFDGGAGSNFSWIEAHQTVWVGSTAGDNDLGEVRVKSIASGDSGVTGTLVVNANSIAWTDDAHLTFKHDYELWSCFPRIDTNEVFYKDFDQDDGIVYPGENASMPPVCIAGPHRAGFLSGGTISFDIPIGNSYAIAPGASISTQSVTVRPSTGVTVNPIAAGVITVDFTVAGQYWVKASVTDDNGITQTTFRSVFVHEDDATSSNYPFVDFSQVNLTGDWDAGDWRMFVKVNDNASLTDIPNGTLFLLWQRSWYGTTQKNISILDYGQNICMAGYVKKDKLTKDKAEGGVADFEVISIKDALDNKVMFSITLTADASPDEWYKYTNGWITGGRIVHHIYRWHSTLFWVADVIGLTDNSTDRKAVDLEMGTLYQMANSLTYNMGIFAHIVADKSGVIHFAQDLTLRNDTDRGAADVLAEFAETDFAGKLTFVHDPEPRTAFVFLSGLSYDGTDVTTLGSTAPGVWPSPHGSSTKQYVRQMLEDQSQANELSGQVYAAINNEWPEVRGQITGNYAGVLEPAIQSWWQMDVASGDTIRSFVWTDQKLIVRNVVVRYQIDDGFVAIDVVLEPEVDGTDGVTYVWPDTLPDPGGDIPVIKDPPELPGALMSAASLNYLPYNSSTWALRTADAINDANQDPYWRVAAKQNSTDPRNAIIFTCEDGQIRRSTDSGTTLGALTLTAPPNDAGDSPAPAAADLDYIQMDSNLLSDGEFAFLARWQNGSGDWRSWVLFTDDDGSTWSWTSVAGLVAGSVNVQSTSSSFTTATDEMSAVQLTDVNFLSVFVDDVGGHAILTEVDGGVITELDDAAWPGGAGTPFNSDMVRLSDTKAIVTYMHGGTNLRAIIIDVTGDTISFGAEFLFGLTVVGQGVGESGAATSAYVCYGQSGGSPGVFVQQVAVSGTTISLSGSAETVTTDVGFDISIRAINPTISVLDSVIVYRNSSNSNRPTVQSVQHSPSWSASAQVVLDTTAMSTTTDIHKARKRLAPITPTSSTMVYVWISATSSELRAIAIDASGSTPSVGSILNSTQNSSVPSIDTHGATGLIIAYYSTTGGDKTRAFTISVSGTTITDNGDDFAIHDPTPNDANNTSILSVDSSNAVLIATYGSDIYFYDISIGLSSGGESKALGLAWGRGDGLKLYVTVWQPNELVLKSYTMPALTQVAEYSLGAAIETEVDAKTRWAFPLGLYSDDDTIIVFGNMDNPASLGDPVHMMYSADAGATMVLMENGFGTDHIGAALQSPFDLSIYAVRNVSGARPKLYSGVVAGTLSLLSTIILEGGVNPKAFTFDLWGNIIVGVDASNTIMIVYLPPPFTTTYDITGNHGTGSGINSLYVL